MPTNQKRTSARGSSNHAVETRPDSTTGESGRSKAAEAAKSSKTESGKSNRQAANGLNTNMEPLMQIHNGSSWGNSKYMRVGEQYDGATYTRGGGQKVSFYDILSTSYKWRMYPPSGSSGVTIADSTSVEFVYIGAT